MTVQLSARLQAIADLVTAHTVLADVGTDHGHLPVWLCETGRVQRAIAMDIRSGPLSRAEESVWKAGLQDRISLRLSDGLEGLAPGEADSIVIAGMGGLLIRDILKKNPEAVQSAAELILGPQSETRELRRFLTEAGIRIDREKFIEEDGKFYPLLHAVPGRHPAFTLREEELAFGPCLLQERNPVLQSYLKRQALVTDRILEHIKEQNTDSSRRRAEELGKERRLLEAALHYYEV